MSEEMIGIASDALGRASKALHGVSSQGLTATFDAIGNVIKRTGSSLSDGQRVAADNRRWPQDREQSVADIRKDLSEVSTKELDRAEAGMIVARAELRHEALPKVPAGKEMEARHHIESVLSKVPADRRNSALIDIASRDSVVSAALLSPWGRDYATMALGVDTAVYDSLTEFAMEAATRSSDVSRAKSAQAYTKLNEVHKALDATRAAAHSAGTFLADVKIHNPDRDEVARLRRMLALRDGHSQ